MRFDLESASTLYVLTPGLVRFRLGPCAMSWVVESDTEARIVDLAVDPETFRDVDQVRTLLRCMMHVADLHGVTLYVLATDDVMCSHARATGWRAEQGVLVRDPQTYPAPLELLDLEVFPS